MISLSALATVFDNTQDAADKFRVVAQAFSDTIQAVTAVSGRVFHSVSSVTGACSHVATLSDLFGVLGIPHDAIQVISSKSSLFKKAFLVNLAACRVLFCIDALQSLKAFDLGKLPHIGATVARYTLGVVAQPLLITLSALEILESLWQNTKAYFEKKALVSDDLEYEEKCRTINYVKLDNTRLTPEQISEYKVLISLTDDQRRAYLKKRGEYTLEQQRNIGIEMRRNWVAIAVNVLKIAAAALTFSLLLGAMSPGLVPAAAIMVAIASIAALGKLFYDFYLNEQIKTVQAPKMI